MKPVKQSISINFAQGLDTKTDPKQLQIGKFERLVNSVFKKGGRLTKRNGNAKLPSLPDTTYAHLTTFNDNLTAVGTDIAAFSSGNAKWVQKGSIQPLSLDTLALIRNNLNQTACDSVTASNGLVCVVYLESDGTTTTNKYAIYDSITGQNIVAPTVIPVASGTVSGGMRVFFLANRFVIAFTNTITGTAHLQYISVSITDPTNVTANADLAASYVTSTTLAWDGVVVGNYLYFGYNTTSGGQSVKVAALTSSFALTAAVTFVGRIATQMSLTADVLDPANPNIYISFYDGAGSTGYTAVIDKNLNVLMNPVQFINTTVILNLTSVANAGVCTLFYEVSNTYPSPLSANQTNYVASKTVTAFLTTFKSVFSSGAGAITVSSATGLVNGMYLVDNSTAANIAVNTTFTVSGTTLTLSINTAGNSAASPGDTLVAATISSQVIIARSIGLASKAFIINDIAYFLSVYSSSYQPTYFLINGTESRSSAPVITAKLAYSNGGGYLTRGLPSVSIFDNSASMAYLFKDLITPVNKDTNVATGTQVNGIYSQTGINLVTFQIGTENLDTSEIGGNIHLSGGFLWMYDGQVPVEQNFFLWPDTFGTAGAVWSATGGSIVAKPDGSTNTNAYYVQFTYEWTDNAGNAFRSAPSIPISITTTGAASTGSITYTVPSLRLTYKTPNPVKVVAYRWSVGQQIYYQTTSITSPTLNTTTADVVTIVDVNADATILGNNILYTTGGVLPNVNAPATNIMALFDTRLWLVDSEDKNLLWFSKQVIEAAPVEMSDLQTFFIPPTTNDGSTGPITALFPMDDKLIIFKNSEIFYINGTGPDITGANNQYSEPIFITGVVGCDNQQSIVLTPQGLMFQTDKGIWLLDRFQLIASYIGADVEDYNTALVLSAHNIPTETQVRFVLNSGITLMYDYYYQKWGTFEGIPAITSCIYNNLQTYINSIGEVYQENPGSYVDGANPVLMSFKTGPLRVGDLQGFQRTFFYYLLGTYISPHKLWIKNYYDYSPNPSSSRLIQPTNYNPNYGDISPYGQEGTYGGSSTLENWRIFSNRRCMALAIEVQEVYDASYGVPAGAGLTLSGINLICGFKSPFRTISARHSSG